MKGNITLGDLLCIPKQEQYKLAEMGFNYIEQGQFENAEKVFRGLLAMDPYDAYYHTVLGTLAHRQGDRCRSCVGRNEHEGLFRQKGQPRDEHRAQRPHPSCTALLRSVQLHGGARVNLRRNRIPTCIAPVRTACSLWSDRSCWCSSSFRSCCAERPRPNYEHSSPLRRSRQLHTYASVFVTSEVIQ